MAPVGTGVGCDNPGPAVPEPATDMDEVADAMVLGSSRCYRWELGRGRQQRGLRDPLPHKQPSAHPYLCDRAVDAGTGAGVHPGAEPA